MISKQECEAKIFWVSFTFNEKQEMIRKSETKNQVE